MQHNTPRFLVANKGVHIVRWAVEQELGWVFREQDESDFGIDAQIEAIDHGEVNGRLIALQIKTGRSYFKRRNDKGFTYYGSKRHLDYWVKHSLPVVLVLCNPDQGICYWEHIQLSKIKMTDNGWKILVPHHQIIDRHFEKKFREILESVSVLDRPMLQGNPPEWSRNMEENHWWYYENNYREQWIAKREGEMLLISGLDIGWEEIRLTIEQTEAEQKRVRELILASELSSYDEDYEKLFSSLEFRVYPPEKYPIAQWLLDKGELYWVMSVIESALPSMKWIRAAGELESEANGKSAGL